MLLGENKENGMIYAASEECAIRVLDKDAVTWVPDAGSPMIAQVGKGVVRRGTEQTFKGVLI